MPRKWRETVQPWPGLDPTTWYPLRVTTITKVCDPPGMRVHLAFMDAEHAGRVHEIFLPLPIKPCGRTRDYFHACHQDTAVGASVVPEATVGSVLQCQFAAHDPLASLDTVNFRANPPVLKAAPPTTSRVAPSEASAEAVNCATPTRSGARDSNNTDSCRRGCYDQSPS